MRFFFIVSSFPWSADANNVKAFILPRRKIRLLKEILATSGVKYISFQSLIGNSMWKAKCCQKTLLRRKYESRRRGTRVLLVVGRRHVPPTWDLLQIMEAERFCCRFKQCYKLMTKVRRQNLQRFNEIKGPSPQTSFPS